MTTKKISGLTMIVVGGLILMLGLYGIHMNYQDAAVVRDMGGLLGGLGEGMMKEANDVITYNYLKAGVTSVVGIVATIVGIYLIGRKEA
jgi:hypothetical protein